MGLDVPPVLPDGALETDERYGSGSGQTYGWSTCAHEVSETVCIKGYDLGGRSVDHLPSSRMSGMRWAGASIFFALTEVVIVALFVVIRGRKRLV